jgi:urease accessory protein
MWQAMRLLAVETLVLGRGAMGEAFTQGLVHDAWHIRRDGRLIWADALHLHGDGAGEGTLSPNCPMGWARRVRWPRCYVGCDAAGHLDLARAWRQRPMVGPPVSMACCCYAGPHLSPRRCARR